MKKLILSALSVLAFSPAFGSTVSEKMAQHIVTLLQSPQIQALLQGEDGVGNLQGVKYLRSGRATFGPSTYKVTFRSDAGPAPQICDAFVNMNIQTGALMNVEPIDCREI